LPNPIPAGVVKSYFTDPKLVRDHRPECLTAIGLVALSWTRLEGQFGSMIAGVLGRTSRSRGGGSYGINPNWIMTAVMGEAETIRARIKIVDAVLGRLLEGSDLAAEWTALTERLYKRARDRNTVVHAEWAWSDEVPEIIMKVAKDGRLERWTEADINQCFERIGALTNDLHAFMLRLIDAIHEGQITAYVTPDMIVRD